ncbi:YkvA family protein [Thiofilum flexile]|uniref:YkvA family protein n=1 Tax=Thiofilum flexile TaxID=125627 RepID=UPI000364FF6A|nr:YkvA family protein [Thiofilum flexile]
MLPKPYQQFEQHYSEAGLWSKLAQFAKGAGRELILKVLQLFYASRRKDLPVWAKTTIYGALGYFISLIDFVPDITPVVGYMDDMGVLTVALGLVASYIDDEVKAQAQARYNQWFNT